MESKGGGRSSRGSKSKGVPRGGGGREGVSASRVVRDTVSVPRGDPEPRSPIPKPKVLHKDADIASSAHRSPKPKPLAARAAKDDDGDEEDDGYGDDGRFMSLLHSFPVFPSSHPNSIDLLLQHTQISKTTVTISKISRRVKVRTMTARPPSQTPSARARTMKVPPPPLVSARARRILQSHPVPRAAHRAAPWPYRSRRRSSRLWATLEVVVSLY